MNGLRARSPWSAVVWVPLAVLLPERPDPTAPSPMLLAEAVLTVFCILGIAALSAAEAALVSVSKPLVRRLADQGNRRARRLNVLVEGGIENAVAALAVSITPLILATATFVGHLTVELLGREYYAWTGIGTLVLILLFCEILPKTYASHHPDRTALSTVVWVRPFLSSPPVRLLMALIRGASWPLRRALRVEELQRIRGFSEEELASLADVAEEQEVFDQAEARMFGSIVSFGERTAREIMVPRVDIVAIEGGATLREAVELIERSGKSRIAVYEGAADEVCGVLYANDVLACYYRDQGARLVRDVAREPFMVPDTKPVDELFRELRQRHTHIALVIDEHGGVDGLVTMEDALEEIIGDVRDEHDPQEEQAIRASGAGEWVMHGRTSRHELQEALAVDFGEDDGGFDTLAGLIFLNSDGLPEPGLRIEEAGLEFTVLDMEGTRITQVRARRIDPG